MLFSNKEVVFIKDQSHLKCLIPSFSASFFHQHKILDCDFANIWKSSSWEHHEWSCGKRGFTSNNNKKRKIKKHRKQRNPLLIFIVYFRVRFVVRLPHFCISCSVSPHFYWIYLKKEVFSVFLKCVCVCVRLVHSQNLIMIKITHIVWVGGLVAVVHCGVISG